MTNDPQTFDNLVTAIGQWLKDPDLVEQAPQFIALAERRFNRTLFTPDREALTTLSTTSGTLALPTDLWEVRNAYLDTDPRQVLEQVSLETLHSLYASQTVGQPQCYALSAGNMLLGPAPDSAYSLILTYYSSIPAVSSSNQTNWLLTKHSDVYLYGSLLMAEAFIWNDPRLGVWKAALDEALGEVNVAASRARYGGSPLRLRPSVIERI